MLIVSTLTLLASFPLEPAGSLNPSEREFSHFLEDHKRANPGKPYSERTLEELRAGTSTLLQYAGEPSKAIYVDEQIPTRDGSLIPLRIYNSHLSEKSPVLIFYPGCAFVFDLSEINNIIGSRIASHSKIKVIIAHYRLAPENPLPTGIYDCYDAVTYVANHSEKFGIDPSRIILAGWCSGAHCSTAVSSLACQRRDFKIFHQILLSGCYDLTESIHSFDDQEREDKTVDRSLLRHLKKNYYGISEKDDVNPLISPYYAIDFQNFPSTTILCGEYDALRNDSEGYFHKLKAAGVEVEKIVLPGQTHNTVMMRTVLFDGPDPAEIIANIVKIRLENP